jgi:hypothetical protein
LELLLVAVALAFAISVLASGAIAAFGAVAYVIAATLAVLCLIYVAWARVALREARYSYEGFLVYDPSHDCQLVAVPGYELAQNMARYSAVAFRERPGLLGQWKSEPLDATGFSPQDQRKHDASHQLVQELVEYIVLEWLSLDLSEYFTVGPARGSAVSSIQEKDIPQVLLGNRFLALFTQPLKDRRDESPENRIAIREIDVESGLEREVVVWEGDKFYYNLFELVLPKGSAVRREADGTIVIDGSRIALRFRPKFSGFSKNLPRGFTALYLQKGRSQARAQQVGLEVSIRIKTRSLIARRWLEHAWAESFIAKLDERFSGDVFFSTIQWPNAEAVARAVASILSGRVRGPGVEGKKRAPGQQSQKAELVERDMPSPNTKPGEPTA